MRHTVPYSGFFLFAMEGLHSDLVGVPVFMKVYYVRKRLLVICSPLFLSSLSTPLANDSIIAPMHECLYHQSVEGRSIFHIRAFCCQCCTVSIVLCVYSILYYDDFINRFHPPQAPFINVLFSYTHIHHRCMQTPHRRTQFYLLGNNFTQFFIHYPSSNCETNALYSCGMCECECSILNNCTMQGCRRLVNYFWPEYAMDIPNCYIATIVRVSNQELEIERGGGVMRVRKKGCIMHVYVNDSVWTKTKTKTKQNKRW